MKAYITELSAGQETPRGGGWYLQGWAGREKPVQPLASCRRLPLLREQRGVQPDQPPVQGRAGMKGIEDGMDSSQHRVSTGRERSRGHILLCVSSKPAFIPSSKYLFISCTCQAMCCVLSHYEGNKPTSRLQKGARGLGVEQKPTDHVAGAFQSPHPTHPGAAVTGSRRGQ